MIIIGSTRIRHTAAAQLPVSFSRTRPFHFIVQGYSTCKQCHSSNQNTAHFSSDKHYSTILTMTGVDTVADGISDLSIANNNNNNEIKIEAMVMHVYIAGRLFQIERRAPPGSVFSIPIEELNKKEKREWGYYSTEVKEDIAVNWSGDHIHLHLSTRRIDMLSVHFRANLITNSTAATPAAHRRPISTQINTSKEKKKTPSVGL